MSDTTNETEPTTSSLFNDPGPITRTPRTAANGGGHDVPSTVNTPDAADVDGAEDVWENAGEMAEVTQVKQYRSHTTRMFHRHDPCKHDLTDIFGVNPELVAEYLHYAPDDHAAVHEMLARRHEFTENDDVDVFEDAEDTDEDRWYEIERVVGSARISEVTSREITEMFRESNTE